MSTEDKIRELTQYIRSNEDVDFSPKFNRDPSIKKKRDARAARRQIFGRHYKCIPHKQSRPPHEDGIALTKNGIPISNSRHNGKRVSYLVSGFNRPHFKKRNGRTEWGENRDAWGKPFVEGKGSRVYMKELTQWWTEASEALVET